MLVVSLIAIVLIRPGQHLGVYSMCYTALTLGVGMLAAHLRVSGNRFVPAGTREFEPMRAREGAPSVWSHYLSFSRAVADYEFRLLLIVTYLLLVAPIALLARRSRSSNLQASDSRWLARDDSQSLDSARRAF